METEAKFIIPDSATFSDLSAVSTFGPYVLVGTYTRHVHDRYVDTAERDFYKKGFFVRLRESKDGGGLLVTMKSLGGQPDGAIHSREEYQAEVPGLEVTTWPEGDIRRIAEDVAHGSPLQELVTVAQTRVVSTVCQGERKVAECSVDEVVLPAAPEEAHTYELEVELLPDGLLPDLRILSQILTEEYSLVPQPLSKFERAMRLISGEKDANSGKRRKPKDKPGVLPTDPMQVAVRKLLTFYYDALLQQEEAVADDAGTKAVHQMRVASRRMRGALQVFDAYLKGKAVRQLGKDLALLSHALGAVRDLDVLLGHARDFSEKLPEDGREGIKDLIADWEKDRKRARKKLVELLHSDRYARLKSRAEAFVSEEPPAVAEDSDDGEVEPIEVRHAAGSAIWVRYEAVRAYETVIEGATIEQLHALRIKGKYLRYTLESFGEVLGPDAEALIEDVTKLQDELGNLHDADVARHLVDSYLRKRKKHAGKGSEPPQDLADYVAEQNAIIDDIKQTFSGTWGLITGPEWRSRLATAIAFL